MNRIYYLINILLIGGLLACQTKLPGELHFNIEELGDDVCFMTEAQQNYFKDDNPESINDYTGLREVDESKSEAVTLTWTALDENNRSPNKYHIYLSEDNFETSVTYTSKSNSIDIYNLKIDTEYHYKIAGVYGSQEIVSDVYNFTTSDLGLRNINISTLSNIRDIGGMKTDGDYKIKQGLLYRCAELNESYTKTTLISKNDKSILLNDLKIKSEIDLRKVEVSDSGIETGGIKTSPLGSGVNYYSCPMVFGGSNVLTNEDNRDSVKSFFSLLADENNYPMVFHCAQGKDRTGAMAYVIEALLGVTSEMLLRDYLFTNFSDINGVCKYNDVMTTSKYGYQLSHYENGDTLKEKTYNYLINEIGITSDVLDNIISIFRTAE